MTDCITESLQSFYSEKYVHVIEYWDLPQVYVVWWSKFQVPLMLTY
jgi:hypothetical protein